MNKAVDTYETPTGNCFIELLNELGLSDSDLINNLFLHVEEFNLPRSKCFIEKGFGAEKLYAVYTGMIRTFLVKGSQEITTGFFKQGDVLPGLRKGECLNAEEDSILQTVPLKTWNDLLNTHVAILKAHKYIMEQRIKQYEEVFNCLRLISIRERYVFIVQHHPELIHRVMQKHLASYIGTTPENLSRIRRTL